MAINVLSWAFQQQLPSPTAKLVLIALADHANAEGECWPSMGRIAQIAGISDRQVSRHIQVLVDRGLVEKVDRRRRNGYLGSWNYRVLYQTPVSARDESPTGHQGQFLQDTGVRSEPSREPSVVLATDVAQKRPKNPLFDAVAEACGLGGKSLTRSEGGRVAKAVKDLKEVGATPEEVVLRARKYKEMWPRVSLTPTALAANWSKLESERRKVVEKCRMCGQEMAKHDEFLCQQVTRR